MYKDKNYCVISLEDYDKFRANEADYGKRLLEIRQLAGELIYQLSRERSGQAELFKALEKMDAHVVCNGQKIGFGTRVINIDSVKV